MKHLWEVKHDYYCNEGNYFTSESCESYYRSFSEFMSAEGNSNMDHHLLFRFDWIERDEETEEPNFNGDINFRNGKLKLFWMGQRRGLYRWSIVEVCRADEQAVIDFLRPRLAHLLDLWAPLIQQADPCRKEWW